jgi:hypothetical protein
MKFRTSPLILLFLSVTTSFLMTSCSSKAVFQTSSIIPAARGYVKVKQDRDQNYLIQVKLDYLSEAERLDPPKKTYVIWMESSKNATRNIGQINSSTGFMSNNLKADFQTTSSYKPERIYITAEDDGTVTYPGPIIVLTTGNIKG